jgi:hypothetical protein
MQIIIYFVIFLFNIPYKEAKTRSPVSQTIAAAPIESDAALEKS